MSDETLGSIDIILSENGNIPSPNVLVGLGLPSLNFNDSMNPTSLIAVASNSTFERSSADGWDIGPPPQVGFSDDIGIITVSSSPLVGISACHDGLLLEGPNVDFEPSDKVNL
jgi:hypothetical protein